MEFQVDRFSELMPRRIERILLVSSSYDFFILQQDGLLTELIFAEYVDLGLSHLPTLTRVSSGEDALRAIRSGNYDLVITMLRLGDMDVADFSHKVHATHPLLPVVLLVSNVPELARLGDRRADLHVNGIFVWHGDARVFLAIIKMVEDQWNVENDTRKAGVGVIILVEDSVRYRSSILPIMYAELVEQTRSVMLDGANRMQRQLRLRARPKILVAENYEEGMRLFEQFGEHLVGVVSDVRYQRRGVADARAGIDFIRAIKQHHPDLPALLQSSEWNNERFAREMDIAFLHKRSATLLKDLREFMVNNFGFGPFIFRKEHGGDEVDRAADLRQMGHVLDRVPAESLDYHATSNHFSNWLRARTEFELAAKFKSIQRSEFRDIEDLRRFLVSSFHEVLRSNRRGMVEDFVSERFDDATSFARIGGGSIGGKARGLAFLDSRLSSLGFEREFPDVRVYVPRTVVIGTEVFDEFLDLHKLRNPRLYDESDERLRKQFLARKLPEQVDEQLAALLDHMHRPLAVRSSSLLEDSQFYPFAGVYETHMIPNNQADPLDRLESLREAVKRVFASTFLTAARKYLDATPHRIEEQKMAVVIQEVVGATHEHYYYPDAAGVMRSYNFYPFGHMKPEDGVACVVLGLGKEVVDGGEALRFCPAFPQVLPQLGAPRQFLASSQRGFYAIDLSGQSSPCKPEEDPSTVRLDLEAAERHGTLSSVASVWSPEDSAFYDGLYRAGPRAVTFAHILKHDAFPLARILERVLSLGREGMGGPVELEFAVNLCTTPREFAILQIRPYGSTNDREDVELDGLPEDLMAVHSTQALGNGIIGGLRDVVYVRPDTFDPARTREIAVELAAINERLRAASREFLLVGPGRWGSSNPWLGIPVNWGQISAARIIVETSLDNFTVDPSQGSHFFHNLTSAGTAYLTVQPGGAGGFVDWKWLDAQPAASQGPFVRHVSLDIPMEARIDGRSSRAAVLKWSGRAATS